MMPTPMPRLQPRGAAAAEFSTSPALANLSHVANPPPPPELETHRRKPPLPLSQAALVAVAVGWEREGGGVACLQFRQAAALLTVNL